MAQVVTVTVKVQLAPWLFALASSTEQVTVVTPTGKLDPEDGEQDGEPTPGQLSATVGAGYVTAIGLPFGDCAV